MAKKKPTRRKKAAAGSAGLTTQQVSNVTAPRARELTSQVETDGGAVLGSYNDPFGGTPVLVVALPIDRVEPTPLQRDPSEPHVKRLMAVIETIRVCSPATRLPSHVATSLTAPSAAPPTS